MNIEILSPQKKLHEGQVKLAKFPGVNGSFEVLENHAPLISHLEKGKIKVIDTENNTHYFDVSEGFVEIVNNKITVLVSAD